MGARGKLGWVVAAVLAFGWLSSGEPDAPPRSSAPVQRQAPRPAAEPAKPNAIMRPAAPARPSGAEVRWLYTKASTRVRAEPSTAAPIVATLPAGELVQTNGLDGDWHSVTVAAGSGWIRRDLLTEDKPAPQAPPATFTAPVARQPAPSSDGPGAPVREPYVGTCDCPYDRMLNGRRCGGNSAYSRPGGRSPVCYL